MFVETTVWVSQYDPIPARILEGTNLGMQFLGVAQHV